MPDTWIERVRAADAEAEAAWKRVDEREWDNDLVAQAYALIAIAAELRALRIARRPGAGQ